MKKSALLLICWGIVSLCMVSQALAHRVNVFAFVEGDSVRVECSYSKSSRVHGGIIEVQDASSGKILLTGKTDDDGNFTFIIPQEAKEKKLDLRILLRAGEGHQNDWTVRADDYMQAAPQEVSAAATKAEKTEPPQPAAVASHPQMAASSSCPPMDTTELAAIVEAAVEKKTAPLRHLLADQEKKGPGLTEIFGGIGYLLGLAGLLAYARSRRGNA